MFQIISLRSVNLCIFHITNLDIQSQSNSQKEKGKQSIYKFKHLYVYFLNIKILSQSNCITKAETPD